MTRITRITPGQRRLSLPTTGTVGDGRPSSCPPDVILKSVSDLWRAAAKASERFAAQALDYDRYRPRYPDEVFDDLVESAGLSPGDRVVEIGAGTGIATGPLVERGLDVTAIEPATALAAVAEAKLADRALFFSGRFEDFSSDSSVKLLTAFNAWHWVEPGRAVDLAARLVEPGGSLALVWTEVISWGQEPFEQRLAEVFGSPWEKRMGQLTVRWSRSGRILGSVSFKIITIHLSAPSMHQHLSLSRRRMEAATRPNSSEPSSGSSTRTSAESSRKWKMPLSIFRCARDRSLPLPPALHRVRGIFQGVTDGHIGDGAQ